MLRKVQMKYLKSVFLIVNGPSISKDLLGKSFRNL